MDSLFTLGLLLVCEAIYLLAVDIDLCKKHLQLVLKHYYAIALPLALLCLVLSLFILGRAYIGPVVAVSDCESGAQLSVACRVTNPEDLAITPDGQFIIASEFGGIAPIAEVGSGRLALLNAQTKRRVPLPIIYSENSWGDASCEKTAESPFGPHGIDLVTREDGRYQLAVVNHMAHESVEMFELVALEREQEATREDAKTVTCVGVISRSGNVFNSTRRFSKRPSSVSLLSRGCDSPIPMGLSCFALTPALRR